MSKKVEIDEDDLKKLFEYINLLVEGTNHLRQKCYDLLWENIKLKIEKGAS